MQETHKGMQLEKVNDLDRTHELFHAVMSVLCRLDSVKLCSLCETQWKNAAWKPINFSVVELNVDFLRSEVMSAGFELYCSRLSKIS
jgi:hypothetical protein